MALWWGLLVSPAGAEERTVIVQVGLSEVGAAAGSDALAVPLDHAFAVGDRLRVTVEADQPGYLYLYFASGDGAGSPLWPPGGGAQAIAAHQEVTVPSTGALKVTAAVAPERFQLLFARRPLADPGSVLAPRQGVPRIRQIRLRGVELETAGGVPRSAFRADLDDRGVAVLEFPLAHR